MIVAAGLLVLLGLGMFVAGLATGATAFFWGCVAVCAVAGVVLVLARRQLSASRAASGPHARRAVPATAVVATASAPATSGGAAAPAGDGGTAAPPEAGRHARQPVAAGSTAVSGDGPPPAPAAAHEVGEPPVEEVEVTDLLLIVDLKDEVLVVDEHPRYHVPGCRYLAGRETIPLPLDEARTDGFTPCGVCRPDRALAERERARPHGQDG